MSEAPKVENAPGLVWRERKVGWVAFWQCRSDLAKRGFKPATVPLWRGLEPSELDRQMISDNCQRMQDAMLVFGRGGLPATSPYDGTMRSLLVCYQTDPDSSFRKNRYRTRVHYGSLLRRIERDHGDERIADLGGRDMMRWHEAWAEGGKIPMAHSLMGMTRTLFSFGVTLLDCDECARMSSKLSKQRFQMGKSRTERLTADMANLIRAKAHEIGWHSIALAQAIQFEGMLRQKDVIGEWVPLAEPGTSDVIHNGEKWLRGILWSEIDQNLILRHVTSKRQKTVEIDLRLAGMVMEEFDHLVDINKMTGPMIVNDKTGLPWSAHYFREVWRKIARLVGIPDTVRSMDTRSGAITEATDAGAQLEDVRHAATHSDISMTQKYSRGSAEKGAKVLRMRSEYRNKRETKI